MCLCGERAPCMGGGEAAARGAAGAERGGRCGAARAVRRPQRCAEQGAASVRAWGWLRDLAHSKDFP